ncbi:MAG: hypothetical protein WBN22_06255 [Verrucomicrobiia bacterium]
MSSRNCLIYKLAGVVLVLVSVSFLSRSQAATIAIWTFESLSLNAANTNTPPDGWLNNIAPETGSGTASSFHATLNALYTTPSGNASANSISANRWSVGDYFQFTINPAGFQDISLSYDQAGSSTGPASFQLFYSANGAGFALSVRFTRSPPLQAVGM